MGTKSILNYQNKQIIPIIILIISMSLFSCSGRVYPSSAKAETRNHYSQSLNRSIFGAQNTLSPYSEEYRTYMQKRYFGRAASRKYKRIHIEYSPVSHK
jgi:hypothetical protein